MSAIPEHGESDNMLYNPESLRYNLESLDEYLETGERIAKDGRLSEAIDIMREAVLRYPDSPTGRYNLGVALFLQVKEGLTHPQIWENLADDEDLQEQALDSLTAAVARDPGFVEAYNYLGRLHAVRGSHQDALDAWEKSLAIMPDQPRIQEEIEALKSQFGPTDADLESQRMLREG